VYKSMSAQQGFTQNSHRPTKQLITVAVIFEKFSFHKVVQRRNKGVMVYPVMRLLHISHEMRW